MSFPHRWLREHHEAASGATVSHAPPPGCCQSLVCYRDRFLILFGGGSLRCFTNEVYVFDLDRHTWSCRRPENSDIVAPRLGHSAVVYKDSMIVYGGQDLRSPVIYDDVLRLDLVTWRWSLLQRAPPFPEGPGARRLHCAHVVGDRMFVLLGSPRQLGEAPAWSLDLLSEVWTNDAPSGVCTDSITGGRASDTLMEPTVPPALSGCSSALYGNFIYVFGGFRAEVPFPYGGPLPLLVYVQTLYEFDTRYHTWRLVPPAAPFPLPPVRYAASMAVHDRRVYIFGGDANQSSLPRYYGDVWRMPIAGSGAPWERVRVAGSGPSPRTGCAYLSVRAALYLVGGETPPLSSEGEDTYSNEMFVLPLGYSCAQTLRDNVARWLGLLPQRHAPASLDALMRGRVGLSLGARMALQPYTQC